MHLTLLVPGLLWPREILRDTTFDLPLPALSLLLGRGRRARFAGESAWLARAFGLAAPLPAAALRLLGDGGDPAQHEWLCLDPVHLRVEEHTIVLDDPARLDLDAQEDQALREAVAPLFEHLAEHPGGILAPAPGRWYLRLRRPAAIDSAPLHASIGRQLDPTTPGGVEGAAWRRLLAEAQPLLHAHPVNRLRDAQDRPTINSLWPWGGGRLPRIATAGGAGLRTFWGDDPLLKGLCSLNGMVAEPLPARYAAVHGGVLARHEGLAGSLASFDAMAWREALAALEANWLAPALAAVKIGALRRLTLVASGHEQALEVTIARGDLWRFWRKPLALADVPA